MIRTGNPPAINQQREKSFSLRISFQEKVRIAQSLTSTIRMLLSFSLWINDSIDSEMITILSDGSLVDDLKSTTLSVISNVLDQFLLFPSFGIIPFV